MPLDDSTTSRYVPFAHHLSLAVSSWNELDRGWQAVLGGLLVTAFVIAGLHIPW